MKDAEETPAVQSAEEEAFARFPDSLIVLAMRKGFILKIVGTAMILSIIVALLLPRIYTATARILPPQQSQSMSALASLGDLGPLAGLAGQGLRTPSDVFVAMLHSETVANNLIDRFSLMDEYDYHLRVDTRQKLAGETEISTGKNTVIVISVSDHNPQRAADLANGYVEELEKLSRTLNVTEAGQRRIFFEREVKIASDDLAEAELALKQTQEKTGLITLDNQSRTMIESLSALRAHVAAQEVLVQSMSSFATPQNPELVRAREELVALRGQLGKMEGGQGKRDFADVPIENVPTAGLEYVRKLRDVKYRETLFELLAKQFEVAKVDEAKDSLVVQQMDRATPPERKSGPPRALIVLSVTIIAFLVAAMLAFLMDSFHRAAGDPEFASRLNLFWLYLRGPRQL